jgi:Zn-dependent protease
VYDKRPRDKGIGDGKLRFTELELRHIGISVLVFAVALSGVGFQPVDEVAARLFAVVLPLAAGFVLHEMAHKYAASTYGYFSVYRMWKPGLVIALVIGLVTGGRFLIAAPGAVVILAPFLTLRQNGIIALVGPLANLALAALFYPLVYSGGLVGLMGYLGARVNLLLAFFNLLPFTPLDGVKVFLWKPAVWAAVAVPSLVLIAVI